MSRTRRPKDSKGNVAARKTCNVCGAHAPGIAHTCPRGDGNHAPSEPSGSPSAAPTAEALPAADPKPWGRMTAPEIRAALLRKGVLLRTRAALVKALHDDNPIQRAAAAAQITAVLGVPRG